MKRTSFTATTPTTRRARQLAGALVLGFSLGLGVAAPLRADAPQRRPNPPASAATRPPDPGASLRIARAQAALRKEPTFDALKNAALRLAAADIARTRHLLRQASLQAILPTFKFTAGLDLERDESLNKQESVQDKWGAKTDRDLGFQITAQWKLSDLIFHADTLRVHTSLSMRASDREKLIQLLAGYVFERRKLILTTAAAQESDLRRSVEMQVRIEELTAIIDALTGGMLSREAGLP